MKEKFMLRLMRYKRVLIQLQSLGLERFFSNNLGDAAGISSAMVRKDLASINMKGNRRGGYEIPPMLKLLNTILGSDESNNTIVVGCGHLGKALLNHTAFNEEGIRILAGFDTVVTESPNPDIPILPLNQMPDFIKKNDVKVAVLAVQTSSATEARNLLVNAGICGILNFAAVELKDTPSCTINNINIGLEIERLFCMIKLDSENFNNLSK